MCSSMKIPQSQSVYVCLCLSLPFPTSLYLLPLFRTKVLLCCPGWLSVLDVSDWSSCLSLPNTWPKSVCHNTQLLLFSSFALKPLGLVKDLKTISRIQICMLNWCSAWLWLYKLFPVESFSKYIQFSPNLLKYSHWCEAPTGFLKAPR